MIILMFFLIDGYYFFEFNFNYIFHLKSNDFNFRIEKYDHHKIDKLNLFIYSLCQID